MKRGSKIRRLTWLDWLKIVIAIDITANGIGLMFGFPFHIFANMFGWVSRVIFGLLYVFMAFLIFARTLYARKIIDEKIDASDIQHFGDKKMLRRLYRKLIHLIAEIIYYLDQRSKEVLDWVDTLLDRVEVFFEKRKREVREEVNSIIREEEEKKK